MTNLPRRKPETPAQTLARSRVRTAGVRERERAHDVAALRRVADASQASTAYLLGALGVAVEEINHAHAAGDNAALQRQINRALVIVAASRPEETPDRPRGCTCPIDASPSDCTCHED